MDIEKLKDAILSRRIVKEWQTKYDMTVDIVDNRVRIRIRPESIDFWQEISNVDDGEKERFQMDLLAQKVFQKEPWISFPNLEMQTTYSFHYHFHHHFLDISMYPSFFEISVYFSQTFAETLHDEYDKEMLREVLTGDVPSVNWERLNYK